MGLDLAQLLDKAVQVTKTFHISCSSDKYENTNNYMDNLTIEMKNTYKLST